MDIVADRMSVFIELKRYLCNSWQIRCHKFISHTSMRLKHTRKKRRHKIKTTTRKKHVFFLTPSIYKCKISNHDKCVNTLRKSKWSLRINNYLNHENHIQILVDWSHSIRLAIDFPSHFNAISFIFISIFVAFAGIVLPRDIFNNSRLK